MKKKEVVLARNIVIKGKVQQVGFRFYAKRKADELGVKGFVKNKSNGSVYIHAEATQPALSLLLAWCYKGPDWARVDEVIEVNTNSQESPDFKIK